MFHHFEAEEGVGINCLVRSTDLAYTEAHTALTPGHSFLQAVTVLGYRRTPGGYDGKPYPPLSFTYTEPQVQDTIETLEGPGLENLPIGIDHGAYLWVDLYGEGTPGCLSEQGGSWFYKRNLSPLPARQADGGLTVKAQFAALETVAVKPNVSLKRGAGFVDLAGTGQTDVVQMRGPTPGLYVQVADEGWGEFQAFKALPTRDWLDPNLRFVDLDGDGRADVLVTEDEALVWHASLARDGFGPARRVSQALDEEAGPRIVFADGTQSLYLADMSGDGLTDLVRIRNGEICYWPNLGYCRFGQKVTMDHAPWFDDPDQFDYRRLRLADIDGTGTADLVYLHRDGVQLYFNQSGNSWSPVRRLNVFPRIDDLVHITLLDLLGNGTACLVWSSGLPGDAGRPLRYVNLMGSDKPHLLVGVSNNLGAETRVRYAPSTRFYLQDKMEGRPWVTRLPFPVHVVEQVESIDHISRTRFVSRYAYHHGYFDGDEREFRGFGMVEQVDAEFFQDYVRGVESSLGSQALEPELNQAPVTTRTWFHTGAYLAQHDIQQHFQQEYYRQQAHLSDSVVPPGLNMAERRECARALKGLPLRQETYSFDGSVSAAHPYSVTETRYEVRRVQARARQRHGVFLPVARESISIQYERNPADPRITQTFALELDEYGGARKSCSAIYGRSVPDPSLPAEVTREQLRGYLSYSETDHTPDIARIGAVDVYRLRVPYETRQFEVTGLPPSGDLYQFAELHAGIAAAIPIEYDAIADITKVEKRLLGHSRSLFRTDSLVPAPLGQWDTLGLPYERYTLAFTPSVISTQYDGRVSAAELSAAGYVHVAGDENWWVPSGTAVYDADSRNHFYLPIGTRDPFGVETIADFDDYRLLPRAVTVQQATWSRVAAKNDYRILGPVAVTDPNGNRSMVEHDELGFVIRSAAMGKPGAGEGDTIAEPTSRMEYELFNWMHNRQPNFVRTFTREQHGPSNPRWQVSYVYSNGSGGVALVKAQTNPGKALTVGADGSAIEVDANPRWIGNGRAILNNKGQPVKQYEPYFSATHAFEDDPQLREVGVSPLLYYDPLGRNIRTRLPDGTESSVVFTPWMQRVFDANDSVKRSTWYVDRGSPDPTTESEPLSDPDRRAAWLAAKHADTPGCIHVDSLGRPVYAVSDHGGGKSSAVRSERDLTGRHVRIFDQLQRSIGSSFVGMTGAVIHSFSAEKGRRWTFQNVLGALVRSWDERGRQFRAEYDTLHRPVSTFVTQGAGPEILFNYVVYGDRLDGAVARSSNLLGAAHLIFDQAGMVRVPALTFQGHPVSVDRILAVDYRNDLDWHALSTQPDVTGILATAIPALETGEVFSAHAQYDALNRPTRVTLPDGTILVPAYSDGNALVSLSAQIRGQGGFIEFLKDQDYDAKGQRRFAHFGNDVLTRYFYDPKTFRLTNLVTHQLGADAQAHSLQNIRYYYDPVGNITQVRDNAQQTHYFNNAVVAPESRFEYDALYQLVRASGRELAGGLNDGVRSHADLASLPLPNSNNSEAVRSYTEEYEYDLLGNIKVLRHRFAAQAGLGGGWTQRYTHAFDDTPGNLTNRLTASSLDGDPDAGPYTARYSYDSYGNMTSMPHLATMAWNFLDQLRQVDLGGGGTASYVYGAAGQRLRKVIERQGDLKLEWIYLGPVSIHRRRRRSTNELKLERYTVHISDNAGPLAQVDTKTRDDDSLDPANPLNTPLIRYQFANHLGSAVLETDAAGAPISYEEYHPYGTSAYRFSRPGTDLSLKRYRFSGKERDDETGLYYFGSRYYAPWLGRWTSTDKAGFIDGLNLYRYCRNAPTTNTDPSGTDTIPFSGFTGNESYADLQAFARANRAVITDSNFTPDNMSPANRGRFYEPNPSHPDGHGGYWRFAVRAMTEAEITQLETPPPAAASPPTAEASAPPAASESSSSSGGGGSGGTWNRVVGGIQLAGGIFEGVLAVGLLLTPEPTMATKVGGVILGAHSLDTIVAGARTLWSGEVQHTLTHQAGEGAARAAGASESTARWVGTGADIAASLGPAAAVGISRRLAVSGAEALATGGRGSVVEVMEGAGVAVGRYEPVGEVIGQATMETCVAGSCRMIASDVGVALTEDAVATALETTAEGASVLRAAEVLESLGVSGGQAYQRATLAQLEAGLASGRSAMVGVQVSGLGRHAMVVDRIAEGRVFLRDPLPLAQGSSFSMPLRDFLDIWSGRLVTFAR
jgi:RHS repeat-associated protein